MIYEWHQPIWHKLTAHWDNQPNAWLLVGKQNTGKTAFAQHFVQALLCETPQNGHEPCGVCPSCHLFEQQAHPDFYRLTPEDNDDGNSKKLLQIKIDTVRQILEPLHQTSVRGGRRVVLINPAEGLNTQAANALLKMLEEPPESVIFLLVAHNRDRVLPTIKSRCRQLILPAPSVQAALNFVQQQNLPDAENLLAFHSHAPLFQHQAEQTQLRNQLLDLLSQPRLLGILDYAAEFDKAKLPLATLLDWLSKWLIDLGLAQQHIAALYYPQRAANLNKLAQKTHAAALFRFQAALNALAPYGHHSLNVKMQVEDLLCGYLAFTQNK
ncbi:DNA polymerase III subunit delta' [Alysiella filiformis]|uniref:DNA polymerase-3 subunit delta n=1 Tax=Alysiella filiformis DSM 16848 TaxID=1120981 RepID=A0A286E4N8_9NEIS|nr:DNA polymerase III subunit delta' [Alysiella filiformis]QMT30465.1 DNA polymerase III subunit delta' [Alysiella filiformis]UBQ56554.1 DNA polymerase III subunit delta' [Alysiella filiformis DSM 16848]SOD65877.1 DNA polymerase-3 subunit delta' [Alysiella filiformis DSM 16848]